MDRKEGIDFYLWLNLCDLGKVADMSELLVNEILIPQCPPIVGVLGTHRWGESGPLTHTGFPGYGEDLILHPSPFLEPFGAKGKEITTSRGFS